MENGTIIKFADLLRNWIQTLYEEDREEVNKYMERFYQSLPLDRDLIFMDGHYEFEDLRDIFVHTTLTNFVIKDYNNMFMIMDLYKMFSDGWGIEIAPISKLPILCKDIFKDIPDIHPEFSYYGINGRYKKCESCGKYYGPGGNECNSKLE